MVSRAAAPIFVGCGVGRGQHERFPRSLSPTMPSTSCPKQNTRPIIASAYPSPKGGRHAQRRTQARRRRSQGQHERPQVRTLLAALQRRQSCLVPAPGGPVLPRRTPSSAAPHQAHDRRGAAHGPAGGHAACPHQEQPPPRLSAEDTARSNRPSKGPRRQSIKGGPSNSLGKGALARKQLLFYPPASFKRRQKTRSNLTKGD